MIKLTVKGNPVPNNTKGWYNKHLKRIIFHKPPKVAKYKKLIEENIMEYCNKNTFKPLDVPVAMTLYIYMPIPASWSKKRRDEADNSFHTNRPDATNILKLVEDAISKDQWSGNFYLIENDKLICETHIYKKYSKDPRIEIILNSAEEEKPYYILNAGKEVEIPTEDYEAWLKEFKGHP